MKHVRHIVLLGVVLGFGVAPFLGQDNRPLVAAARESAPSRVFNIRSHGAVGDGVAMETEAIQETIDACHAAGGGVVRVPAGDFQIGTIHLKSHITLSLDYGASLLGY